MSGRSVSLEKSVALLLMESMVIVKMKKTLVIILSVQKMYSMVNCITKMHAKSQGSILKKLTEEQIFKLEIC